MLVTFKPLKSGRYRCNQTGTVLTKREVAWYRNHLLKVGKEPRQIAAPLQSSGRRKQRSSAFRRKHS